MIKFSIVVVIYNKSVESSATLQSLFRINLSNKKVIIWDNSPHPDYSLATKLEARIKSPVSYLSTPENISLAKIYNEATKMSSEEDFLVIFDHDTDFDQLFFDEVESSISANSDINLFAPYIQIGSSIYSPGDFVLIKGKYWERLQTGRIKSKNKVMVASGMTIKLDYLRRNYPVFNESLRLYGIDSDFSLEYAKTNDYFFVINHNLKHHLSVNESEDIDKKLFRFKDMCYSTVLIAHKRSLLHFYLAKIYVTYLSIKMSVAFRDYRFLKIY